MYKLSSWWGAGPALLLLLAVTAGCSSSKEDDDDDDDVTLDWKCWANTRSGICECRGYGPNESGDLSGTDIEEAEDCSGRAVCFSYYSDRMENDACACGDASFVPSEEDISNVNMTQSCPPE